jgi:F-type H+-transporting ATPase subunit gamma
MSETMEGLKRKLGTAGDLQSVVRTMKTLAASSIGQYEKSVESLIDYSRTIELGLSVCLRKINSIPSSSIKGTRKAIIFGSDQGLVGQFNERISDFSVKALSALPEETKVWAVGSRIHARLTEAGFPPEGLFVVPNSVNTITSLIGEILIEISSPEEATELYLFYNHSNSSAPYTPKMKRLLPLDEAWKSEMLDISWPTKNLPEQVGRETLPALIREYLFISLFQGCAESLAAENASRLAAMQRADKNIDELLESLNAKFNHLRQSSIDEELFDVVSAFETLSKAPK